MLSEVLMPVYIVGGLGLVFGICLAYASKKFEVKVDERIASARELLPGANCGACGFTGCDGFAEGVVEGKAKVSGCPVGGSETARKLGELMGVSADDVEKKVARVMCGGTYSTCSSKYDYSGLKDCAAAAILHGGPSSCGYGCVGLGNCARACPFGAIVVEDGLAKVIDGLCTGCEICVASCPKNIIRMNPVSNMYTVQCSSLDKGAVVRKNCSTGCIGCGKCVKACPSSAINLKGTLAEINPALCTNCGECYKVCPTGSINLFVQSTCNIAG